MSFKICMSTHRCSDTSWPCVASRGQIGRGHWLESGSTSNRRIPEWIFPYLCWIKSTTGSSPGRCRLSPERSISTARRTRLLWTLQSEMNLIWRCCPVSQSGGKSVPKSQSMLRPGKLCMICVLHYYLLELHNTLRCSELSRRLKSSRQVRRGNPEYDQTNIHLCWQRSRNSWIWWIRTLDRSLLARGRVGLPESPRAIRPAIERPTGGTLGSWAQR